MANKMDYIMKKISDTQKFVPKYYRSEVREQLFMWFTDNIDAKYNYQSGGIEDKKEFIAEFRGYKFDMRVVKTKYDINITTFTHNDENPSACITIYIRNKIATVSNLSYHHNCTVPFILYGDGGGALLLKFVLAFLGNRKEEYDIERIVLTDHARKICPNCTEQLELSTIYFLMNGHTWYGKYGFRPYDRVRNKPNKQKIKLYENNQKIIEKTKVQDVDLLKYIKEAIIKYDIEGIDIEQMDKIISKSKDRSLWRFIKELMKAYDKFCCIFVHINKKIYKELGLHDFFGEAFYLDI